jgi:beta-lactamase regulating signal transducer with metallopeptidase domain
MTTLLQTAISNVILATALAFVALAVTRLWKNRHVAHLLWVIVLAKLVTPPLWNVPMPVSDLLGSSTSAPVVSDPEILIDTGLLNQAADVDMLALVGWPWIASSMIGALIVFVRVARFHRIACRGQAADEQFLRRVERIAKRLGLRSLPDVRLLDAGVSPMVWPLAWRRMLLLPTRLVDELTPGQLDTVIAHELAHLVRRDELVRFLEALVTCLFWWNPLVWFARRELRAAEEDCCDALVVCSLPDSRQQYGEALLRAAEMFTFGRSLPALASAFGQQGFLKRRIEMILNHKFHRSASWQAKLLLLVLACCVLPLVATVMSQDTSEPALTQPTENVDGDAGPVRVRSDAGPSFGFGDGGPGEALPAFDEDGLRPLRVRPGVGPGFGEGGPGEARPVLDDSGDGDRPLRVRPGVGPGFGQGVSVLEQDKRDKSLAKLPHTFPVSLCDPA